MPAQPSQDVATTTPQAELVRYVRGDVFRDQVAAALPPDVPPARFIRATVTALLTDPKLVELDRASLFQALVKCAADGLMPDGRQAALVPFKSGGVKRAQYLPMIGGYRKIAAEHGWTLRTNVVREGDDFELALGGEPVIVHRPKLSGQGDVTGAYAVAVKGPQRELEYMDRAAIEKVRNTSRAKSEGPWVEWFERMAEKTVGRRLFAKLPLADDDRVRRVLNADDLEHGEAAELVYGPPALSAGEEPAEDQGPPPDAAGDSPESAEEEGSPPAPEVPQPEAPAASSAFSGEEPPRAELLEARSELELVLPDDFTQYAGRTIASIVDSGDRVYLRWLVNNAADEAIVSAAKAGLEELSR